MVNIQNGIITMNRGDTFYMPLLINVGSKVDPTYYAITEHDSIYFALEEYNQPFEYALVRKKFTLNDVNEDGNVIIHLESQDTEKLLPGDYYYEIKLCHASLNEREEFIDTIVPRRKFIILE